MVNTARGNRTALVAGASGLVGSELLAALLTDARYSAVLCLGRRRLAIEHPKLTQQSVDFQSMPELPAVDDVFIALGTTLKVAGSQAAMRALDVDAVVAVARAAKAAGAQRLGVVSSMGANAKSAVFYTRIKGEMEEALLRLDFAQTVIAQPSQLSGPREALGQPDRAAERLALKVMAWFKPLVPVNYQPIAAKRVARALLAALARDTRGVTRLQSGQMQGAGRT
jgi:uncharacterized protein YbjT (DUF2867 family)